MRSTASVFSHGRSRSARPKWPIGCDLLVDRTPKVQTADDRRRAQVKALADQLTQAGVGQAARSEGVDKDRDGMGNADGIGQLDLALGGKTCRHKVLGDVTAI